MNRIFTILSVSAFLIALSAAPVFAAGGKHHGEKGKGDVHQGDIGDAGQGGTGGAPGNPQD
jgi:hypothetical protein